MLSKKDYEKLIKDENLVDIKDVNGLVKNISKGLIETMLERELTESLGYEKHDKANNESGNTRNGYSKKTISSTFGQMEMQIPRDRLSEFEPLILRKGQRELGSMEEKILLMYSRGMSERDIVDFLEETYGHRFSTQSISNIIAGVTEYMREWQSRPLSPVYAAVFLDAIIFKVKTDGIVKNIAVYSMLGINMEGRKDILGLWTGETESAKYWLRVLSELKDRGVKDVLIFSVDGLKGFTDAISSAFPNADIQKCIVHQVRNSLKFVSYKDKKMLAEDLKAIYKASDEEKASHELDKLSEKWDKKYPYISKSWKDNWAELSTFFQYPAEIRRIVYTTNPIESYHRSLRKITKTKGFFPNEESLLKLLFLVTENVTKKWNTVIQNWGIIYSQLLILFGERIEKYEI